MITAQHVVNIVLDEAAKAGRADETMVLVTDTVDASLRWAGNSMTTNGVSIGRSVSVISVVRQGDSACRCIAAPISEPRRADSLRRSDAARPLPCGPTIQPWLLRRNSIGTRDWRDRDKAPAS